LDGEEASILLLFNFDEDVPAFFVSLFAAAGVSSTTTDRVYIII
jgi:hypothetical protein